MMLFTKPMQWAACVCCSLYYSIAFRVRWFGTVPRYPGPSLLVANHQHEMESPAIIATQVVAAWTFRKPFYTVSSRRMWEPGFFAERVPWLRPLLRNVNLGWLFAATGMQPIENELHSRPFASVAYTLRKLHGNLDAVAVFKSKALERAPGIATIADVLVPKHFDLARSYVSLSELNDPYRSEMLAATRAQLDADIAHFEELVRNGATIFLTPEGFYTTDGKMQRFRGILSKLTPLATTYIAAISYDPFVSARLSMLYRVKEAANDVSLESDIKRSRPITTSALLGSWLHVNRVEFDVADAIGAVTSQLWALPPQAFVDPELARDPKKMTARALRSMLRRGMLQKSGDRLALGPNLRHPQFTQTADMLAFQANFHAETMTGLCAQSL